MARLSSWRVSWPVDWRSATIGSSTGTMALAKYSEILPMTLPEVDAHLRRVSSKGLDKQHITVGHQQQQKQLKPERADKVAPYLGTVQRQFFS